MPTTQELLGRTTGVSLRSFLHPKSIAVVGASDVASKVGHTVIRNLLAESFPGQVYPVNSCRERVMGRKAYTTISALPESPELAVMVTPARTVPGIVKEYAAKQIRLHRSSLLDLEKQDQKARNLRTKCAITRDGQV